MRFPYQKPNLSDLHALTLRKTKKADEASTLRETREKECWFLFSRVYFVSIIFIYLFGLISSLGLNLSKHKTGNRFPLKPNRTVPMLI